MKNSIINSEKQSSLVYLKIKLTEINLLLFQDGTVLDPQQKEYHLTIISNT